MAHGLVLRMQDYVEMLDTKKELPENNKQTYTRKEEREDVSEVVQIIESWMLVINNSKNSRMEFFSLLRQTLLFILLPGWNKCTRKNDLLQAFTHYYQKFSTITANVEHIHKAVLHLSNNPWQNHYFKWEDLPSNKLAISDKAVQSYFQVEPEELVLARCQALTHHKQFHSAMSLAKLSFLYHSRVRKSLARPSTPLPQRLNSEEVSRSGQASIDWFIQILERLKTPSLISRELSQFTCHEGVEIICRAKRNARLRKFSVTLIQIFVLQDLLKPSKNYCCTKKLFHLFCAAHKELNSSEKEITESVKKIVALFSPSSAHLYLFVDALWEQFGLKFNSLIELYAEFYVRGLTADANYLEVARSANLTCDITSMENHIAFICFKLSTLFTHSCDEAERECMFSAFSLRPSATRFLYLKSLSHRIQERLSEVPDSDLAFRDCTCSRICNGYCRISTTDHNFSHPLLKKGIRNISYSIVKDLVSILESVRTFDFQYNVFSWSDAVLALNEHLNVCVKARIDELNEARGMSEESSNSVVDVTPLPDGNRSNNVQSPDGNNVQSPRALVKRKSSTDSASSNFLDVGANIEVNSNDGTNKKMKLTESTIAACPGVKVKMQDAIEKVIRKSLSSQEQHIAANDSFNVLRTPDTPNYHNRHGNQTAFSNKGNHEGLDLRQRSSFDRPSVVMKNSNVHYREKSVHSQQHNNPVHSEYKEIYKTAESESSFAKSVEERNRYSKQFNYRSKTVETGTTHQSISNQSAIRNYEGENKEKGNRHSVIQHTMHTLGIKIPNEVSVSLNTAQQLQNISKNVPSISPFNVKVPTESIQNIPNRNVISANLVIKRQSNASTSQLSHGQDVITIPGILASPSVIKRKFDGPYEEYKKVTHSTVQETYSHPYQAESRELVRKITKKETVYHVYKPKQHDSQYVTNRHQEINVPEYTTHNTAHSTANSSRSAAPSSSNNSALCSYSYKTIPRNNLAPNRPQSFVRPVFPNKEYGYPAIPSVFPQPNKFLENRGSPILKATLSQNYGEAPFHQESSGSQDSASSSVVIEDDRNVLRPSYTKDKIASKTCCSPLEVNPCQTCSVSSESKVLPSHSGTFHTNTRTSSSKAYTLIRLDRWINRN